MILRNKQSGEIGYLSIPLERDVQDKNLIEVFRNSGDYDDETCWYVVARYKTLVELNKEWEEIE